MVVGALAIPWLGLLLEALFIALWPLSYDLTQGADFSYEYLLQYQQVWEFFRPILERFESTFPTAAVSLEQLTVLLSLFWIASFAVYLTAFLVLRSLPQGWWSVAGTLAFTLLFQVTLFLMPGTFTTDLFSYAMYGIIPAVYELNPYIYVPGFFPANRMTSWIHPIWYYTPSIYGPVWIDFSIWVTGFTRDRTLVDQALAYRLVSNVAHLVNLGLVGALLWRLRPPKPASLLLLFAWNPLLLFEFAASGHNDSFMLTFVLLAGLLTTFRRHVAAVAALALAALVKVTPILLMPLLVAYWAGAQRTWRARLFALILGGLIPAGLAVALYAPWYNGPDTFQLIEYWSKGPMYMNYVPDLLAQWLAENRLDPDRLDPEAALEAARTGVKWVTRIAFLAYYAWELLRLVAPRDAMGRLRSGRAGAARLAREILTGSGAPTAAPRDLLAAMSRVFLVFLLLVNTWVLPWYLTWPLILAIPLGWERLETRLLVAFSLSAPLMMYNHHYWSIHMTPWLWAVYVAPLALLLVPLVRRLTGGGLGSRAVRRDGPTAGIERVPAAS